MHPLVEHTGLDPALPIHPLMGGAGARKWDLAPGAGPPPHGVAAAEGAGEEEVSGADGS